MLPFAPRNAADLVIRDEARIGPDPFVVEPTANPEVQGHEVAVVQEHHPFAEHLAMEEDELVKDDESEDDANRERHAVVGRLRAAPHEQRARPPAEVAPRIRRASATTRPSAMREARGIHERRLNHNRSNNVTQRPRSTQNYWFSANSALCVDRRGSDFLDARERGIEAVAATRFVGRWRKRHTIAAATRLGAIRGIAADHTDGERLRV